ncbi:MAG: SMC family ATPase [Candidatus Nanopelagicales bacterium]|nr:SMC family ATPase [Candidatus Nanopelagicales bacterium]
MQIHKLRFGALGPYPGEHVIDFDALGRSALFIIDGPTGSGKSTILDALVFALYADVSGSSSDKQRLRSAFADATSESYAEVEFTTAMGSYKVRRNPEFGRPKIRGEGLTLEKASTRIWRATGEHSWELLSAKHVEADLEISRAIGLDKNQFQQTVVLPQGEFATFLKAKSADRQQILEKIFATSLYSQIQEQFDEERRVAERDRQVAQGRVRDAAQQLIGRLTGQNATQSASADEIDRIKSLEGEPSSLISQVVAEIQAAGRQAVATAEEDLISASRLKGQQEALVKNLEKALELEAKATAASAKLDDANLARGQAIEHLAEHQAVVAADAVEEDCDLEIQRVTEEIGALSDLEKRAAGLPARKAEIDKSENSIVELCSTIEGFENERALAIPAKLRRIAAFLGGEQRRVESEFNQAEDIQNKLFGQRLTGMSAELSENLVAGVPCPVCGSLEHPTPTVADRVSEDDLAQAKSQLAKQNADRRQIEGQLSKLAVVLAAEQIDEAQPLPVAAEESADAQLVPDVDSILLELQHRLVQVNRELAEAKLRLAELRILKQEQEQDYQRGTAEILAKLVGGIDIAARVSQLKAARTAIEAVRSTTAAVSQAAASSDAALKALTESPDLVTAEVFAEANQLLVQRESEDKRLHGVQANLLELADSVDVLGSEYVSAAVAMDELACLVGPVIRIADVLNGRGANTLSQPLKAYVVQQMFDEVIAAANIRLSQMLAGRFALVDTESATGLERSLGLGLEVRDLVTETNRRTETLSGGETFCASLALALGLADTVKSHAGGVEIGVLFVDEGFGALDQERLDDVMAELLKLRADGRTVGVISHVSEMKKSILERITVLPLGGDLGSTLEVSWM